MSDGNVRVAVRVRPLCARERLAGSNEVISLGNDGVSVVAAPDRQFTFDSVFGADIGQDVVFGELAKPLVEYFVDGFNCTILAYGQTGSGKTFTMGTGLEGLDELTVGIIPRAVQQLVGRLEQVFNGASGTAESGEFFELYVSFLELYNEEIVDLLSSQDRLDRNKRAVLTIREDTSGAICIAGIKEEKIGCGEDIMECLQKGTLGRTTKSTDMNLVSSRSHAVFTITLRQRRMVSDEMGVLTLKNFVSKLHFVDLAGSERVSNSMRVLIYS
jgi:kinesin family protein 4/21/27